MESFINKLIQEKDDAKLVAFLLDKKADIFKSLKQKYLLDELDKYYAENNLVKVEKPEKLDLMFGCRPANWENYAIGLWKQEHDFGVIYLNDITEETTKETYVLDCLEYKNGTQKWPFGWSNELWMNCENLVDGTFLDFVKKKTKQIKDEIEEKKRKGEIEVDL